MSKAQGKFDFSMYHSFNSSKWTLCMYRLCNAKKILMKYTITVRIRHLYVLFCIIIV